MADIHARVERLIALAVDPKANENEARTAALVACHLIHEHKLLQPAAGAGAGIPFDLFADLFGPAVAARRATQTKQAAAKAATSKPRMRPDPNRKVALVPPMTRCNGCGIRLQAGSPAVWSHYSYWHGSCLDKELSL